MSVYLVYGPPCSGKTTWVKERASEIDLIIDADAIKAAICKMDPHTDNHPYWKEAQAIVDLLKASVGCDSGGVVQGDTYLIGAFPKRAWRSRTAIELNAKKIFIDADEQTCIHRAQECRPEGYEKIVRKWFERYEPDGYTDELYHDEEATRFYHSNEWKRKRQEVLELDHHECQSCRQAGRYTRATVVHHRFHLKEFPQYGLDIEVDGERNLISLCEACHNKEHPEKGNLSKKDETTTDEWW